MRVNFALFLFILIFSISLTSCSSVNTQADGDKSDGDITDGDKADGDEIDGDETDGDVADGDGIDSDEIDGDEIDSDVADGDTTDEDMEMDDETESSGDSDTGEEDSDIEDNESDGDTDSDEDVVSEMEEEAESTTAFDVLGTLGGSESAAFGLNNLGQIVGWAQIEGDSSRHGFVWTEGSMKDIGLLAGDDHCTARAINDSGTVVGTSESNIVAGSGDYRPFVYKDETMLELPSLGGTGGWASDVNAAGVICGYAYSAEEKERAVTWTDGVASDIANDSGKDRQRAYGINEGGEVIGWEYQTMSGRPNDVFRLDDAGWTIIGGEDGQYQNAEGYDINNSGVAAGFSSFPTGSWNAAIWTAGSTSATDVGSLEGYAYAELYGINNNGIAVGRAYIDDETNSRAILWDGENLIDINDQMPESFNGVIWEARDINDSNQIAATAKIDGKWMALRIKF